ncbi:UNVERIFIED_CONTAM: hypothetical protein GTU68_019178 [Idotea baltica]|nr:hypothetical protein [Idotea baltica]
MEDNKEIVLSSQIDPSEDEPTAESIYQIGVVATVLQLLKLPDGTVKVLVEGKERVRITEYLDNDDYFEANADVLTEHRGDEDTIEALSRSVSAEFDRYSKLNKNVPEEALKAVEESDSAEILADTVAGHLSIRVDQKQELLETLDLGERLETIYGLMQGEMSVLKVEKKIKSRVKNQMERTQREYYLNEQMKAIQKELGDSEGGGQDETAELETKISETKLSKEAKEKAEAELKKLRNMSPMSAEATVVRNYLDWMLSIPWNKKSRVKKDLNKAQTVLDTDHYGLEKVKERIVEYLAVQQRSTKLKGPIMCLVGPPGVGKTSLGKSVARATGREFIRISLGGVRDESEIRGHRRTYIGSMPGKIIQAMKKAKTNNPLILLDEIDKMGQDHRGDPASALLEVLDPEQNGTFVDHYLEVEYDLSNVMFLTTSNSYNIPGPLLDRMEVIALSGYTEDEKQEIAKRHLLEKQMKNHGLRKGEFSLSDDGLLDVVRRYTREAGVRNLERELAKLCRKAVTQIIKGSEKAVNITAKNQGATPKDGPSAGVGMVTSIVSVLTGIPVRKDIAMTGEVTLRGNVLPIGGLKEKLLAALRGGVKTVLIPKDNQKDLPDIPDNVKAGLEIIPVSSVSEVLEHALIRKPESIDWDEAAEEAAAASKLAEAQRASLAH